MPKSKASLFPASYLSLSLNSLWHLEQPVNCQQSGRGNVSIPAPALALSSIMLPPTASFSSCGMQQPWKEISPWHSDTIDTHVGCTCRPNTKWLTLLRIRSPQHSVLLWFVLYCFLPSITPNPSLGLYYSCTTNSLSTASQISRYHRHLEIRT